MNEKEKQTIPVKTSNEILQEVTNKLRNNKADPSSKPSIAEVLGLIVTSYSEVVTANEARKSPEQRAREAKQSQLAAHANRLEKAHKNEIELNNFFEEWLKRDTWLIYDEAMPLIKGEKPEAEGFLNLRDTKLWELVQSCATHSLTLTNKEVKPKQWRVKPFEWIRWLLGKKEKIHPQLITLVYPKTSIPPALKTTKANNSREILKRDRQKAIKAFALEAEIRARKNNIEWSKEEIAVTKSDFLKVLGTINPVYKKITAGTFDNDITDIGLKFKRGTKSNKNNMLNKLFSIN